MEQVEGTITDVDKKVERILKLIKRRNRAKKEPELIELIQEFNKQYQSLYAQYDKLRRETGHKAQDGKVNEGCSYSASSSDSEYYSSEDIEINTDITSDKKRSLHRRMADNPKEELERAFTEVADLKQQLASKTEEKKALASNHLAALSKVQEIETINGYLRKEVDEKEKRLSALGEVHKGRVTELEEQLTGLKTELESLHHQKRDLEAQLNGKTTETKHQGETNKALNMQILEFELIPSEEGDETNKLMMQIKANENNFTSKIEDSMAQVSNLKKEVDYLRAQKCEAKGIACKSNESLDQANIVKQELDSLRGQQTESVILLERKSEEVSRYLIQVKSLKEELASKSANEQIMVEEKEGLWVQLMDLNSEVDTLRKQKNISEEEARSNIHEINQLRDEKCNLQARILELEAALREKYREFVAFQEDSESKRVKDNAQVMTLNEEVKLLQQKLHSLMTEKSQLESQIAEQQRIAKEREESANKSVDDSNSAPVRRWSSGSKLNNQVLERKMEDLAEEFRKKVEDNIRLLYQRIKVAEKIHFENKETYNKTKESLEQENGALKEKLSSCEAEFRKLRDTMESGKKTVTRLSSVVTKLEDDVISPTRVSNVSVSDDCDTRRENEMKQLKSNVDLVVAELDKQKELLEAKLREQGEEKLKLMKEVSELESRVTELGKIMKEKDEKLLGLQEEKKEAIRQLCLMSELESRVGELKKTLKEKNETLLGLQEEKKEASRQLCLMGELESRVRELEKIMKEKDESLLGLQEEKREAIRQLCLLTDYHRSRCDILKEFISKLAVRSKKKT